MAFSVEFLFVLLLRFVFCVLVQTFYFPCVCVLYVALGEMGDGTTQNCIGLALFCTRFAVIMTYVSVALVEEGNILECTPLFSSPNLLFKEVLGQELRYHQVFYVGRRVARRSPLFCH